MAEGKCRIGCLQVCAIRASPRSIGALQPKDRLSSIAAKASVCASSLYHRCAGKRQIEVDAVCELLARILAIRASGLRRFTGHVGRHGLVQVRQIDNAQKVRANSIDLVEPAARQSQRSD